MYYEVCGYSLATNTYHISCPIDELWIAESTAELWAEGEDDMPNSALTEVVINVRNASKG